MANKYQDIDLTTPQPNGKTGEPGPSAWKKAKEMFQDIYLGRTDVANRLHYMDAAGKDAFTTITQAARDLLDDADAAAMLKTLGLGAPTDLGKAMLLVVDAAAGRDKLGLNLVKPGAYFGGIPRVANDATMDIGQIIDFHDSNTETGDFSGRLASYGGKLYWTDPTIDGNGRAIFNQANIVGNVGFVNGRPSGSIIQFIAGADGQSFGIRFADGTQVCWGRSTDSLTANGAYGSGYISSPSYTAYPAAFVDVPIVQYVTQNHTNAPSMIMTDTTPTATSCSTRIFAFIQNATARYGYTAYGRWT